MFVHINVLAKVHNKVWIKMVLINRKNKAKKTSKGYRLKVSTHRLIDKIQIILNADQDTVITRACRAYYKSLNKIK